MIKPKINHKLLSVLHHLKKVFMFLDQNLMSNTVLNLKTFDLLNFHCLTHSAMCPLRNTLYAHACKKKFSFDEMFIETASSNFTFSEHCFTERARHDIWTEQPIHIIV